WFEPDTLLPIQYFEAMRKKHLLEGEKRLILSVLEDAVECFMKGLEATTSKGQRLFRDAEEWINLEDKRWVFSFDNVCEMLDINPEYMRVGLRRWKERRIEAIAARRAQLAAEAERAALEAAAAPAAPEPAPTPEPARARIAMAQKRPKAASKPQRERRRRERVRATKRGRASKLRKARA
ncbi:MAG TPA: hypothetical protein VMT58_05905, partial [Candidatus Binataceae bacterium]|nr:hypothetical protein [Candidatus Binataceae bacterium]